MKRPMVSVVIPIYNAELYLDKCLNSIKNQSMRDIEVLCVDDASTDGSKDIINRYVQDDKRFRLISIEHWGKGAGHARNVGIAEARGKYLSILDADDFFDLNMLQETVEKAESENADIVIYNAYFWDNLTKKLETKSFVLSMELLPNQRAFSWRDIPEHIFQVAHPYVWTSLYRTDFVKKNNIFFLDINYCEDIFFVHILRVLAKRIAYIDKNYVYYRVNNNESLTGKRDAYPLDVCVAVLEIKKKLIEIGMYEDVESSFINEAIMRITNFLERIEDASSFLIMYKKLKEYYINEIGFKKYDETFYYNDEHYKRLMRIIEMSPEEYLFARMRLRKEEGEKRKNILLGMNLPEEVREGKKRVIIYGGGKMGRHFFLLQSEAQSFNIVSWVDINAEKLGYPFCKIDSIKDKDYDYIIITIEDEKIAEKVKNDLQGMGVEVSKIVWLFETID